MNKLFLFNPEFDLNLSNTPISQGIKRSSKQMSTLLIPALKSSDRIITDYSVDESFYNYLQFYGIHGATPFSENTNKRYIARCWGVDNRAISTLSDIKDIEIDFPNREIVKEINSREFAYKIGFELNLGVNGSRLIKSSNLINNEKYSSVIKPLFGNAGSGFIYSDKESLEDITERVDSLIDSDGAIIIEPWLDKIDDIATLVDIKKDGEIEIIGHHRNISNRAGSFYANYIEENDTVISPWRDKLNTMAKSIAEIAHKKGYWGYLGIDSITYKCDDKLSIAMAIDINGRAPISIITYGIRDNLRCTKPFLYRFIAKRRVNLPNTYEEVIAKLGNIAYSKKNRRGVIMVTPLIQKLRKSIEKPPRTAWVVIGNSEKDTFDLDAELRTIILKH